MKSKYEQYTLLLGKGYALNVYLPALAAINYKKIVLVESAKNQINDFYINKEINWINENDINNYKFSKIIIAEPPNKQYHLICKLDLWKNSYNFILEKPASENPEKAKFLFNILNKNNIKYSINYSFRYTRWFSDIYSYCSNNKLKDAINVNWNFNGRYWERPKPTWKTNSLLGGGVIKYYGIHLIAVFSDIGYTSSKVKNIFYHAKECPSLLSCDLFSKKGLPKVNLKINSNSNKNQFYLNQNSKKILEINSPFSLENSKKYEDNRIIPAINFLKEQHNVLLNIKNLNVLDLWSNIESQI